MPFLVRLARCACLLMTCTAVLSGSPGCVSAERGVRDATVRSVGAAVSSTRDCVTHAGTRWDSLDTELVRAVKTAPDDRAYDVAFIRLIDSLNDGHAYVRAPKGANWYFADGVKLAHVGRAEWVSLGHPVDGPLDAGDDRWMRLVAIDGYQPRTRAGTFALLAQRERPGETLEHAGEITLTLEARDGSTVDRTYRQGTLAPDAGSYEWSGRSGYERIWLTGISEAFASLKRGQIWMNAMRFGPGGSIGYLRVGRSVNAPDEGWAQHHCTGEPSQCEQLREIDEAMLSLRECRSLIIDLQGCGGGTCAHAGRIAGWILPPFMTTAPFAHRVQEPVPVVGELLGIKTARDIRWSVPTPEARLRWDRLIVLVDGTTGSAAEHIPACLRNVEGVTIIGTRTAGCEYSLARFTLANGDELGFGAKPVIWDPPLQPVECIGVAPTIEVPYNLDLLRRLGPAAAIEGERRAALEAALARLGLDPAAWLKPEGKPSPPRLP